MRIYIDTETTGIPNPYLLPGNVAQPNLVQVAALLVDDAWVVRASFCAIVKPEGWTIPAPAMQVHGISTLMATAFGLPLRMIVPVLHNLLRAADEVVAHNFPFDERVINTAFARQYAPPAPWPFKRSCTMEMATRVLRLPATPSMRAAGYGDKYKNPNLEECVRYFFRRAPRKAHDALADAQDCMEIHRRLLEGGKRDAWYRGWLR